MHAYKVWSERKKLICFSAFIIWHWFLKDVFFMKKTLRTVLTAAMFAAANLSALPTSAEELNTEENNSQNNWSEWANWSASDWNDAERATGQIGQLFYGSFPVEDLNDHSHDWKIPDDEDENVTTTADNQRTTTTTTAPLTTLLRTTTTTVYPIYGPGPNWKTTTGTVPPTTTPITTTMPQLLYGAPYYRRYIGDINMDGMIDSFDMIALRKLLIKGRGESPASESYSDLNGDKKVNMADLILLQRYLLGKVNELIGGEGYLGFMENVDIEKIGSEEQNGNVTTTTTSLYDPREDIVVSLYGIRPAKEIIDQAIWQTKDNIDINISSEDE